MNIEHKIDDRITKLICVPLIGILFPNITGLIVNSRYSITLLLVQYCYFIFLLYVLWKGNILVILLVKNKMNFDKADYHKYILTIIISTVIYSGLIVAFMLKIWSIFFK